MTYAQALEFWFGRINYEQRVPEAADLKLDRIRELLARLGNPHNCLRIVHVAGSKGKGSTSAMLASILRSAGYRVGLFTSPHLVRPEERIQVDGKPISADELTSGMEEIRDAISGPSCPGASGGIDGLAPTFFEISTALGFLHFVRRQVDVAVIEVGLGGRFDSTNVCKPEVAVITSISLDHTRQLGDRIASIAMEKAGIVKTGVPTISGATLAEARDVIQSICRERSSPLTQLGVDLHYWSRPGRFLTGGSQGHWLAPQEVQVQTAARSWPAMEVALLGDHQAANAALAVAAVEKLQAGCLSIPDSAVSAGLAGVCWPARMEVLGRSPVLVLDCAHNVDSAATVVQTLQTSFPPTRRILIFAASQDKDVAGMFHVLAPHFQEIILCEFSNSPRAMLVGQMQEILTRATGRVGVPFTQSGEALAYALSSAEAEQMICITGSVFLAGEMRPLIARAHAATRFTEPRP